MKRYFGDGKKCFIIAEIGVNHQGDVELAKEMIQTAKKVGADAVKFQTWITEENTSPKAPKASYQKENSSDSDSLYSMIKKLELSLEDHKELKKESEKFNVQFFSRASSPGGLKILKEIGIPFIKIGSLDITYHQIIAEVAAAGLPIILSTGASRLGEIEEALDVIYSKKNNQVMLMHCTSNYPTKMKDVNLRAMITLKHAFGLPVGYSDHTLGHEVAVAAVALGANAIEKHFTLNKNLPGPDHKASLEPNEFEVMVKKIRNVELALGNGIKAPCESEKEMVAKMRRSVVAVKNLSKDTILTEDMLAIKRPGTGIQPKHIESIVGRRLKKDVAEGEPITHAMV